jgi:hypothetical protein
MSRQKVNYAQVKREEILAKISIDLPQLRDRSITKMLSRIAHYHYGRKIKLSIDETLLLNLIKKLRLNPHTVYRWFLLEYAPEDVQVLLEEGKISLKNAAKESKIRRTERRMELGVKIIDEIRQIVGEM